MFGRIGRFLNIFNKSDKSVFIELSRKNTDKEYIIDNNEYYDHPEPKVMSEEEIIMSKKITDNLSIEEGDHIDQAYFKDANGNVISGDRLKNMMTNPEADNFVIPGQIKPGQKQQAPVQQPPQPSIDEYSVPQLHGGRTIPIQGGNTNIPPFFLYTTEDSFYFFIELSGTIKETIKVKLNDLQLTISGEYLDFSDIVKSRVKTKKLASGVTKGKVKTDPIVSEKSNVKRMTEFKYQFSMSKSVDEHGIVATMTEIPGILLLELPFRAVADDVSVTIL